MELSNMGERMKGYEAQKDYALSPASLWVMRLDGNNFSRFTKRIKAQKPYDTRLMDVMRAVCGALAERFNFVTVYTQSDEITCVPNLRLPVGVSEPMYGLRIQKLCSLVASYASVVFYKEAVKVFGAIEELDLIPTFDARIFVVPNEAEVLNTILWRQRDCVKNAKNLFGQQYFSHKQLQGLTSDEQVAKVEAEKGFKFESTDEAFRYGVIVKRELWDVNGFNPKTQEPVKVQRSVLVSYNELLTFSPENVDFVMAKYAYGNDSETSE